MRGRVRPSQLGVGQRLVGQPFELDARSLQGSKLRQPGASSCGASPVYSGATSLIASDFNVPAEARP